MSNSVTELIDAPGVTLERLLDEDSFISQLKSGSAKVQQFMKYDKYKTLVKYITEVGPSDDRKRSYKYPLSSCQLLSCDNNQAIQFFFSDSPIIIRQEVIDNSQSIKEENDAQSALKELKTQPNDKVVIKDKLDNQQSQQQLVPPQPKQQIISQCQQQTTSPPPQIIQQQKSDQQIPNTEEVIKKKIIEKEVDNLRNDLFLYFEGQVNYTLAGYVSKVFSTFFTKKPQMVMKFLLETEKFKTMIKHIQSRSVGQLIVKLLSHQSTDFIQLRKSNFSYLIQKVSKNDQIYIISNIATPICQIIEKFVGSIKNSHECVTQLYQVFITPAIITQIISNVMSDEQNVSVYNAPILQTYLSNISVLVPEKLQNLFHLEQLLVVFFHKTLQKLKIKKQDKVAFGFGRMKIIQILSFVLKQNILNARKLIAGQNQFFEVIFDLCKNYQYNNILHNQIVKIIQIALNQPEDDKFLHLLLDNDVLLNFISSEVEEDKKIRAGEGGQKSRKGYIGHIVVICNKVQEIAQRNPAVSKLTERNQFLQIMENLVNKQTQDSNRNLAGYSMKRGAKHSILFMKQDVIQEHIKFLTSTPPPIFETQTQQINIQHPDLIEAEKIQAETIVIPSSIKQAIKIKQEEENFDPRFFGAHLQFNIDDLINDL